MINVQLALLKREVLEHRAIYVMPIVLGLIVCLSYITGQVTVSAFDQAVDMAILGATNLGDKERAAALSVGLVATSSFFVFPMLIFSVFYMLDSLYAERKDKSILFWRSLPVTDTETVLSKLMTALVVVPLVTFVVIVLTHLCVLVISSVWVGLRGADAWHLIWRAAPLFDTWAVTLIVLVALPLWLSPFAGWFLFVSAFTKRSPLLVAFLPIVVLPLLEKIFFRSSLFAEAIFERSARMPIFGDLDTAKLVLRDSEEMHAIAESGIRLLSLVDVGRFLAAPALWLGLAVCGLFIAAAIYVRRYRDETWI
ncbi:MAG: ABC-2 transporter permease [Gammaproteobacteria bacterium]|nr:ABC-2 transporter permease [Gammaproteobacteria bacterium]MDH5262231.1 ABC-2 transporter permease [Gammaproteobacteria bacterium]